MQLPFTTDQFFAVFGDYNEAVWPVQIALLGLAVVAVACLFIRGSRADAAISGILAFMWLWTGLVYHITYFSRINGFAVIFGGISIAGAAVFFFQGILRGGLRFLLRKGSRAYVGWSLLAFALVIYPILTIYSGHSYPEMPTFGLPCPTTIFTIGVLAFLEEPYPRHVLAVPVLWTLVGVQAAFLLGVPADLALLPAGAAGIWLAVRNSG